MPETPGRAIVAPRSIAIAGEPSPYQDEISAALVALGNRVCSKDRHPASADAVFGRSATDLVVVVASLDRALALRLIGAVRHEARLPVVAAIERGDAEWTGAAVAAGASAALIGAGLESLRATVHAACERFAEFEDARAGIRAPCGDRAGKGRPDGEPGHSAERMPSPCCATIPGGPIASSSRLPTQS